MEKERYFAKSFEEDFILKTLKGKRKVNFQSIDNIIKTKTIKPNTKSFGRERRLSCSFLHKNYLKTYRPHGLIFQTEAKPNYILPFDIVLLGATDNIIVHYYRIKNNLYIYYNHKLIDGFNRFIFKDFNKMIEKIYSPSFAWKRVNEFRKAHGYKYLPYSKYRLVEYNEVVFHKKIKIKPIAIFGYRKNAYEISKKYGLPHFISAKRFFDRENKK